jgi:hypothetical protein
LEILNAFTGIYAVDLQAGIPWPSACRKHARSRGDAGGFHGGRHCREVKKRTLKQNFPVRVGKNFLFTIES